MSLTVPLGVRFYQQNTGLDWWVTRLVSDIQFRSVVPGGFASADITLYNDGPDSWSRLAKLFVRVQIVDLRTRETAWEGRVESSRRNASANTWAIGCLGGMVVASDITIPYFAIDGDVGNWTLGTGAIESLFSPTANSTTRTITMKPQVKSWAADHYEGVAIWQKAETCDMRIGRFDCSYLGGSADADFRTGMDVATGNAVSVQTNVDVRAWSSSEARFANRVGTEFTSTNAQRLTMSMDVLATSNATNDMFGTIKTPLVQAQRVDRVGAKLQATADYPNEYVRVWEVVEDVLGRFLVGAWNWGTGWAPWQGEVRGEDAFIDTSSTAQIRHLAYYDGTTAAQVLNDLMTAQPDAYWAIWETSYGATGGDNRFRFEWARWPAGWGYLASSIDGLEEQPDGANLYNYIQYLWKRSDSIPYGLEVSTVTWHGYNNQLLGDAGITRGVMVRRDEPSDGTGMFDAATATLGQYGRTTNTGTLTVRRPIQCYDPGTTGGGGMSRMLDPWMIRPGRLLRITDLPARGMGNELRPTPTPPNPAQDGIVFRVVGTTYSSADNSCTLELDTVPGWELANQVAATKPASNIVVRG
ncbi:hypothetical protein [Actinomadura alba]|uniref:Minor tail protein n=1 Tax=Actinomadura alba TaxID=406431 RepID=A0ABR7LHK1_9ACTN|nr:hypothetical protein [Actinomadura alba]MBC6464250.1 hypothetical protein [Actinomadura alba]